MSNDDQSKGRMKMNQGEKETLSNKERVSVLVGRWSGREVKRQEPLPAQNEQWPPTAFVKNQPHFSTNSAC